MGRDSQKRKTIIAANYKPLHPHLYTLQVNFKHFGFGIKSFVFVYNISTSVR